MIRDLESLHQLYLDRSSTFLTTMTRFLCLILGLIAVAAAAPESRIVGGSPVTIEEFPYIVSYTYFYPGPAITIQRCVGCLLSSWHVLTTGYCFTGAVLDNMQVRAGSTNSLSGGTLVNIRNFVKHPDYAEKPRGGDLAVTTLQFPLGISDTINVLYLPPTGTYIPDGQTVKVVSWGFESETGPQIDILKTVNLQKVNTGECQIDFAGSENVAISDNVICANNADGRGMCLGDSGAPMVIENVIVGVSSFFERCGSAEYPDVFTRVDRYTNWILEAASAGRSGPAILSAPVISK